MHSPIRPRRPAAGRLSAILLFSLLPGTCVLRAQPPTYTGGNPGDNNANNYTLAGSTTLTVSGTDAQWATQSGVLSGTGPVHKTGAASLFFTADNTYTGGTFVDQGELVLGSYPTATAAGSVAGDISLASGTAVNFLRSNAVTFNGNISYAGNGSGGARDGTVDISAPGTSFTLGAGHSITVSNFYFRGGTLNLNAGSSISTDYNNYSGTGITIYAPGGNNSTVNLANGASFPNSYLNLGGTDSTAATSTLNILAGATVDLTSTYLSVGGVNAGGAAVLNIGAGATANMSGPQFGGYASSGSGSAATINLASGSTLAIDGNFPQLGGDATSNGDGGDATLNINSATFTVTDVQSSIGGAGDSGHHGGNGTLNVDGAGSTLHLEHSANYGITELYVGHYSFNGGSGTINVTNGAKLYLSDTLLGGSGNSTGTLNVSGSGSTLNLVPDGEFPHSKGYGHLYLGGNADPDDGVGGATGTITLSNYATAVVEGEIHLGGQGGGSETTSYQGGAGILTLSGGASLTAKQDVIVGGESSAGGFFGGVGGPGGSGTITLKTGATLDFQNTLLIGGDPESAEDGSGNGVVNLGAATLTSHSPEGYGPANISISSTGTLNIGHDGTAATAAPNLTLNSFDAEADGPSRVINDGTINFRHSSGTFTLAAPISGSGALNQMGAGATVLTGDGTDFTGTTTISAGSLRTDATLGGDVTVQSGGTLVVGSSGSLTGSLTLANGAHFDNNGTYAAALTLGSGRILGGTGTFTGLVTADSGAHIAPGNSPGTITFTGGLALNDGAVFDFQLGSSSDLVVVSGGPLTGSSSVGGITLNLSNAGGFAAGTYTLLNYAGASLSSFDLSDFVLGSTISGYTYSLGFANNSLQLTAVSAVPEPATVAAIMGALTLGFGAYRKRRRA